MADTKLSALTEATTLDDADELYANDSGTSKRITSANLRKAMVTIAPAKTTPVNADEFLISDSAASNAGKKITMGEILSFMQTSPDLQAVRVWGVLDGATGAPELDESFNVDSVTDEGVGQYLITVTTAFPQLKFPCGANCNPTGSGRNFAAGVATVSSSSFRILIENSNGDLVDKDDIMFWAFGDQF